MYITYFTDDETTDEDDDLIKKMKGDFDFFLIVGIVLAFLWSNFYSIFLNTNLLNVKFNQYYIHYLKDFFPVILDTKHSWHLLFTAAFYLGNLFGIITLLYIFSSVLKLFNISNLFLTIKKLISFDKIKTFNAGFFFNIVSKIQKVVSFLVTKSFDALKIKIPNFNDFKIKLQEKEEVIEQPENNDIVEPTVSTEPNVGENTLEQQTQNIEQIENNDIIEPTISTEPNVSKNTLEQQTQNVEKSENNDIIEPVAINEKEQIEKDLRKILKKKGFPINLIDKEKFHLEGNVLFLNEGAYEIKEDILQYAENILTNEVFLKKNPKIKETIFLTYLDKAHGLVIIPKTADAWKEKAIGKDMQEKYEYYYARDELSLATYDKYNFSTFKTYVEIINNTAYFYILWKYSYDAKELNYTPYLLEDVYTEQYSDTYKDRLKYLQQDVEKTFADMDEKERKKVLYEKYSYIFGKRKMAFTDINAEIGLDDKKAIVAVPLYLTNHIMILGKTSMGKSVLLKQLLYSLLSKNNSNELSLFLGDPKQELLQEFYQYEHLDMVGQSPDKILTMVNYLRHIMEERLNDIGGGDWTKHSIKTGKIIKPIVCIIEEFVDLTKDPDSKGILDTITRIAVKGRAAGIYLILIAQFYNEKMFDGAGSQFTKTSVFSEQNRTSEILTGNQNYLKNLVVGEGFYSDVSNKTIVRIPFEDDYTKYMEDTQFKKKGDLNYWTLMYNIDLTIKVIDLYESIDIIDIMKKHYLEKPTIFFEVVSYLLIYIYVLINMNNVGISMKDFIGKTFILTTLFRAIAEGTEQYSIYNHMEIDSTGSIKNMKIDIEDIYKKSFMENKKIFPKRNVLFDPKIEQEIINIEAQGKEVPEDKLMAMDKDIKIEGIKEILEYFTEGYFNRFKEKELIEFYLAYPEIIKKVFHLSDDNIVKIKESDSKTYNQFINEIYNEVKNSNNEDEVEDEDDDFFEEKDTENNNKLGSDDIDEDEGNNDNDIKTQKIDTDDIDEEEIEDKIEEDEDDNNRNEDDSSEKDEDDDFFEEKENIKNIAKEENNNK